MIDRLERVRAATIAQVQGVAAGGGCVIALACDLRVCTPEATFGVPVARTLGNCLSAANYARLRDLIGPAGVKDLMFTGRLIDGHEAARSGWSTAVVDGACDRRRGPRARRDDRRQRAADDPRDQGSAAPHPGARAARPVGDRRPDHDVLPERGLQGRRAGVPGQEAPCSRALRLEHVEELTAEHAEPQSSFGEFCELAVNSDALSGQELDRRVHAAAAERHAGGGQRHLDAASVPASISSLKSPRWPMRKAFPSAGRGRRRATG